jgi:hypothetical protein
VSDGASFNGNGNGKPLPASAAGAPEPADGPVPDRPDPEIEIVSVRAVERGMAPEVEFEAEITDRSGRDVHLAALTVTIEIEPARRSYDERARELLGQLFGEGGAWSASTRNVRVARVTALSGPFTGGGRLTITVPMGFDLEVAAGSYLYSLADGEAPLRFHFNGTIYYRGDDGSLQLIQLPWDRSSRFRMPVEVWRRAIAAHYPNTGWIALDEETIERLRRHRAAVGAHSFAEVIAGLLDQEASAAVPSRLGEQA